MPSPLKELSPDELKDWLQRQGEPAFRAKQIREWLYDKWAVSVDEMSNLPQALRDKLEAAFTVFSVQCTEKQTSADGTIKYGLALSDGSGVEAVLIPASDRRTVCISSQVGCPVRCAFCASGADGLKRNLGVQEIVDQVIFVCRELGERVDNVVLMGVGEPLLNLENVQPALETISGASGLGIGARNITVSTSGIVPGIYTLADAGRQWNLAVSLHAGTEETRARLVPSAYRYSLESIRSACLYYREKTKRMVTIEYALLEGVNDNAEEARALACLATEVRAKVNVIPYNTISGTYTFPEKKKVEQFVAELSRCGARVTVRKSGGADIDAACGQLRQKG